VSPCRRQQRPVEINVGEATPIGQGAQTDTLVPIFEQLWEYCFGVVRWGRATGARGRGREDRGQLAGTAKKRSIKLLHGPGVGLC
jgi:hypothetical protein